MTEKQFINEKSFLYGAFFSAIAYGIVVTLAAICLNILWAKRLPIKHRRFQFIYVILVFMMATLSMGFEIRIIQAGFLEQRDFNGGTAGYPGPAAYLGKNLDHALPIEFKAWMACLVLTNWFCDSILLWRCMILYQDNQLWPTFFKYLPSGLLAASFITGVLHLIQITAPETSAWATANLPFNFTILYGIVAVLVNLTLTTLITLRLLIHRRRTTRALGAGHGNDFTTIVAMLIESAVLADIFVLLFLIPYSMRHWFCNITIQPLIQVQAMAPLLIIYRVAQGKAWSSTASRSQPRSFSTSNSSQPRTPGPGSSLGFSHHRRNSSQLPMIRATDGYLGMDTAGTELRPRPSESSTFDPYELYRSKSKLELEQEQTLV
ncbi:hypothetical protein P691DRAFT_723130 [Macrolepiota fuliginosa MF-IS2]|uniref:Uncharacterized protein n=1 Tax=Macrolepiota fuliginosa MF-IS2 TaxID=1400762 RepID=A0A9P5XJ62_9AGAR|nr:hypothetical protein P691DRAFT_723130 [Macrolepiota fuliginosa MF-IS2]